ncbi:cutinase transcription factor 1 beta [Coniochaeta sp. 2T2.1]|nr:cutinase transcription factor 1 beta [Coniochaeta sp. 2T2.1]
MDSTAPATETAADQGTKKSSNKIRKRAPKACLSCRARKVRCDVSQRGRPCMNCYLDSETCVVTGRASRFRRQRENGDNPQASYPPYPQEIRTNPTAEEIVKSRTLAQAVPESTASAPTPENHNHNHTHSHNGYRHDSVVAPSPHSTAGVPSPQATLRQPQVSQTPQYAAPPSLPTGLPPQQFSSSATMNPWAAPELPQISSDIVYSYYPFLNISNLTHILPQDVNYLESQGCFRVPTRAVLDEFVQQYFLHVHPLLPLFNEGDFWDVYCQQGPPGAPQQRMSLLVFQALIFATCNFVSRQSIKALGYPSIRTCRAALYRRAKLLYDFESESSPICIAQAALLLSFWSPVSSSGIRKANSTWLTIAIQHAKVAEAHHYSSFGSSNNTMPATTGHGNGTDKSPSDTQLKRQNILKRLWWCCIIRDRILALCVRRSIQITRAHFDLDANSPLGSADLADEIDRSKVYNADTKRALIDIMSQLINLCVLLTDMLVLVYPLDDSPGWGRPMKPEDQGRVKDGKMALRRWYKGATLKFPMFGGGTARASNVAGGSGRREYRHDSVILYTNLMYMYYHSGRVALCHHEVLHLALAPTRGSVDSSARDVSTIYENRHELQDAASGVTECLKELIQLKLARWLPISAVACTALPLVLHILDVKLSSPRPGTTNTEDQNNRSALKQHRLNVLIEAMKTYQPQYDGVDWVSETIRHIVNLAQLDGVQPNATTAEGGSNHAANGTNNTSSPEATNGNAKIQDWTDILTSHPSLYLRLALTMDLSLSKDRLPDEGDFPASLRGLLSGGSAVSNPVRVLLRANTQQQAAQQQPHYQDLRPVPGSMSSLPPQLRPKPRGAQQHQQPRAVAPIHTMKQWLGQDRAVSSNYGIAGGLDGMDLDEPDSGGLPGGVGYGSDSESGSQESYESSMDGQHQHQHHQSNGASDGMHQQQHQQNQESFFQPFTTEEMELLEAHVLDAFTLHNESPSSSEGVVENAMEIFGEALGADAVGEWFEQTRKGDNGGHGGEQGGEKEDDVETARVLVDAMKDQEVNA